MKRVISVLVENKFGVLAKVSRLFSSRGFNIHSLTVGETHDPTISRMTIVAGGDDRILDQVEKQLNRLIDVLEVVNLTDQDAITTEHMLIKIKCNGRTFSHIKQIIDIFRAQVRDVNSNAILVEITGDGEKHDSFINLMKPFGIIEVVRSGIIAISRKIVVHNNHTRKKRAK